MLLEGILHPHSDSCHWEFETYPDRYTEYINLKKGFKTLSWILRFDFKRISFVNLSILDFISENQCHSELQSSFVLSFMDAHKSYIFTLKIIQYVVKKRFIRILVFQLV